MSKLAPQMRFVWRLAIWLLIAAAVGGCSRRFYRWQADRDASCLIDEKSTGTPWSLPSDYSVLPDARSRLYDSSDADYPLLPPAGLRLYSYKLPPLSRRGAERASQGAPPTHTPSPGAGGQGLPPPQAIQPEPPAPSVPSPLAIPPGAPSPQVPLLPPAPPSGAANWGRPVSRPDIRLVSATTEEPTRPVPAAVAERGAIAKIPDRYWGRIPQKCQERMFEFATIREEYSTTYGVEPSRAQRDPAPKLTLENIVELARINSREYQTQKERLYQAALALSLERFDYSLRFSTSNNGVDANYTHLRTRTASRSELAVPYSNQVEKMLATGGNALARFANNVVLTFNGPNGFAADVTSELLFSFTQSVLQRDILLEPLIQSERDLIYAARTFARYRKTFFFDLANAYYSLLRDYRQVEINSQDYFSRVRNLEQLLAELRAGITEAMSRDGVDQIEQSTLGSVATLIRSCNTVEQALDRLKITIGLPTETPINLDLSELEQLTRRDEAEVTAERARRWRDRLDASRTEAKPEPSDVLNSAIYLIERLQQWQQLRRELGEPTAALAPVLEARARFRVDDARLEADRLRGEYERLRTADRPPPPILRFRRALDLLEACRNLARRQLELADQLGVDQAAAAQLRSELGELDKRAAAIEEATDKALESTEKAAESAEDRARAAEFSKQLARMLDEAENRLLPQLNQLIEKSDRLIGAPAERPDPQRQLEIILQQTGQLLAETDKVLSPEELGLTAIRMGFDEAMATALVQSLDLMNQRGALADEWRAVKLAADDLKSVLNLNASQSVRGSDTNQPIGTRFLDSTTQLRLSFDMPLNRRSQRNAYRRALINYQASLRQLMAREDNIKLSIRNDVRTLDLTRVQYPIYVTQAALAAERVDSIRLKVALGLPGVNSRLLLDALDDYRSSVTNVAGQRISYIVERAQFALDLELMVLDDEGFWSQIRDDRYQPTASYQYPTAAGSAYGEIPKWLCTSRQLRQMDCVAPPSYTPSDATAPTSKDVISRLPPVDPLPR